MTTSVIRRVLPASIKPPLRAARARLHDAADALRLVGLQRSLRREWGHGLMVDIHPDDEMAIYSHGALTNRARISYLSTGAQNMRELGVIFRDQGIELSSQIDVLDFAGGFGRLTRYLVQVVGVAHVTHCDISPEAVQWVAHRLGVTSVLSTAHPDAFRHRGRYDLILAISLFSHLPHATWGAWLAALYRLLKPDGRLLFTTHGATKLSGITPAMRAALRHEADGFEFVPVNETLGRLPEDQYGSSYLTPEWVAGYVRRCALGELAGTYPNSLWGRQDAYVVHHAGVQT
jgi:SAM-dependent methyltransferase